MAANLQAVHKDGLYFVPLAAITDPDLVASALVTALGLPEIHDKSPQLRLLAFLRQKELLLLLDNFEQIAPAAPLVAELLAGCPRLRVLVTSRERLHLRVEQRFLVPPLDLVHASALFTQRAQTVEPAFTLTSQNQTTVTEICQLLDCLPLAIELAAVQMALFSPQTLLERLQTQRLDSLNDGPRDLPSRHRSLRAVFDRSWRLLPKAEQRLLAHLSIFRGGFTPHAVEQVTGASAAILLSLMVKSLVRRQIQEQARRTISTGEDSARAEERCDLHELIRHYAAEQLTQLDQAGESIGYQHSRFYCRLLREQERKLQGAAQQAALALIALEIDNIRTAWRWAVAQQQVDLLEQAMHSLGLFYEWHNHYQEGLLVYQDTVRHLQTIGDNACLEQRVQAAALAWQSVFCRLSGHLAEAGVCLQQSLTLLDGLAIHADVQRTKAFSLLQLGHVEVGQTTYQAAEPHYRQALALYQLLADPWGTANVFFGLGTMYYRLCEYAQARTCYETCLTHYRAANDYRNSADTLERLAYIFRDQGQFAEAEQLTMAAIALYDMMNDRAKIAHGQLALGWLYNYTGRHTQAYAVIEKAAPVFEALGLTAPLTAPIVMLAIINMDLGQYAEARRKLQSYLPHSRNTQNRSELAFSLLLLTAILVVEGNYGTAEPFIAESITHYQKTGEQDRLAQAIALSGFVARGMDKRAMAQTSFAQALQIAIDNHGLALLVLALLGCALLLAEQDEVEWAIELYATVAKYPIVANSHLRQDLAHPRITALAAMLPPAVVAAARSRGEANDLWATANALLPELNARAWVT